MVRLRVARTDIQWLVCWPHVYLLLFEHVNSLSHYDCLCPLVICLRIRMLVLHFRTWGPPFFYRLFFSPLSPSLSPSVPPFIPSSFPLSSLISLIPSFLPFFLICFFLLSFCYPFFHSFLSSFLSFLLQWPPILLLSGNSYPMRALCFWLVRLPRWGLKEMEMQMPLEILACEPNIKLHSSDLQWNDPAQWWEPASALAQGSGGISSKLYGDLFSQGFHQWDLTTSTDSPCFYRISQEREPVNGFSSFRPISQKPSSCHILPSVISEKFGPHELA